MYKSLNLNREKIHQSIRDFLVLKDLSCGVSEFEVKGDTRRRIHISGDENFYIDFHFLKNGSTSIDLSSGDAYALKVELAQFIKEDQRCSLGDVHSANKWFVVKNIDPADFLSVIELLVECEYNKNLTKDGDWKCKFTGSYNENLAISFFPTTKTALLQGRPLLLFNEAVIYFTELIDLEDIPQMFNGYFNVEIKKENVEAQYQYYFPLSYDKHRIKFKKVLYQAIYNLQLKGEMFDYSFLVFPALKALEGHLKNALETLGISLTDNKFSMFKRQHPGKKYYLDSRYHGQAGSVGKVKYFEDAYNFYNAQRHSAFHWADPTAVFDETRIIENIGEAQGLITDALSLIDAYYAV